MMHLNLFLRSLVLLGVLMGSGDALAQRDFIEQLRSDLRAEKVAVLSESMELEEAESEKFWPVYREYELELWKLGDRRLALLKRYAQEYESLGNAEVKSIAQDWFELREDQLELERKVLRKNGKGALGVHRRPVRPSGASDRASSGARPSGRNAAREPDQEIGEEDTMLRIYESRRLVVPVVGVCLALASLLHAQQKEQFAQGAERKQRRSKELHLEIPHRARDERRVQERSSSSKCATT